MSSPTTSLLNSVPGIYRRLSSEAIERSGAAGAGIKAMGKVMATVTPQTKGRADGAVVAAEVKRQLAT